jgi:hypothetical protein
MRAESHSGIPYAETYTGYGMKEDHGSRLRATR